jgi:hypothetical protein
MIQNDRAVYDSAGQIVCRPLVPLARERRYLYTIVDPGGPEHGRTISFGPSSPPMFGREPYQLADGRMAHIEFAGVES